ncbi:hypothetical protein AKJ43_00585 [candidate division MSBL1 archaeon SCGC-AAA261D19]|uniref:Glutamine--fructose-6-phosphate aminotransferase [isomerizing] n=1 Tax=candidate division MSBL1 archaeon SCGC-AAA261D19 TaxID=1698273 RepID=A0A133V8L6_9EURY|nr:hypothetical protein AKJ43_00585 [candidate division MSBL1 archaeon SCGC-AAA261D19]
MCGIIGYVGRKKAAPLLLDGLKRLEYRGYDSAGIATVADGIQIKKDQGKIDEIDSKLDLADMKGTVGIGHARWATHGEPSQRNAHPHMDADRRIAVVHNGIIENYEELREFLKSEGYKFKSETDTEVIPHLINYFLERGNGLEKSVRLTARRLKGSYAIAIAFADDSNKLVVVREQSPLIIGIQNGGSFVASDIPAVLPHTNRVLILEDGEMGIVTLDDVQIKRVNDGKDIQKEPMEIDWTLEMAEKRGYPHFMLKEINEQATAIQNTLRVSEEELNRLAKALGESDRVYVVACGTSYHAALVGKYALAKLADFSAEVVISSEFQESCIPRKNDLVFAITQSGETADTLKAVRVAKEKGSRAACLTNVVGSSITRISDLVCFTHAGPEIGVAATKTFSSQVTYLLLLAHYMAKDRGYITSKGYREKVSQLKKIPASEKDFLERITPQIEKLAKKYRNLSECYFIGRGIGFPIALEGSLKLKEIAYVNSVAYPAGELKHGPLALVEEGTLLLALVTPGSARERMIGNIEEVKARGAEVVALAPEGLNEVGKHVEEIVSIPSSREIFSPLIYVLPLQLLAYCMGIERGYDPDKPRHLAKSVTVE